ncbi:MAG TPA: TetR/AcrR family transcriptional regulator, partial [Planctomycetes bacterium]|nr:TetR/AcrR family transcriptional regulator [Planctomycetota bacterium]
LERALRLFWEKGYDRTSVSDIGEALGVGPSSIYNAFGSKAELFRRTIEHYAGTHAAFVRDVVHSSDGRPIEESLRELLHRAVSLYTTKGLPPGCAMLQAGGSGGSTDSEGGLIAKEFRCSLEKGLRDLLTRASRNEALAASPRILAKYLVGVMRGLSQLAADGASRKDLLEVADHALGNCVSPESEG